MKKVNDFKQVFDMDFCISHTIDDLFKMDSLHFHNVFEIYLAQTGGLKYFVDNIIYPVEKNDLFIFNHLDLHRISIPANTHYDRYIALFSPDYIKDMSTDSTDLMACFLKRSLQFCHRIHLSNEQAQYLISLFGKAENYIQSFQYGDDVYKKIILSKILIYVNNLYRNNDLLPPLSFETEYNKIKPVLSFINEYLHQKLSLDYLSQHFFISKYHLCKIFKNATGFTINEYIIYRRILKATELLRKDLLVSQVSEMVEFQNDCHFITTFKKYTGISPKQYAKRISN